MEELKNSRKGWSCLCQPYIESANARSDIYKWTPKIDHITPACASACRIIKKIGSCRLVGLHNNVDFFVQIINLNQYI